MRKGIASAKGLTCLFHGNGTRNLLFRCSGPSERQVIYAMYEIVSHSGARYWYD